MQAQKIANIKMRTNARRILPCALVGCIMLIFRHFTELLEYKRDLCFSRRRNGGTASVSLDVLDFVENPLC